LDKTWNFKREIELKGKVLTKNQKFGSFLIPPNNSVDCLFEKHQFAVIVQFGLSGRHC
jgi:hypothetical protein